MLLILASWKWTRQCDHPVWSNACFYSRPYIWTLRNLVKISNPVRYKVQHSLVTAVHTLVNVNYCNVQMDVV